MDSEMRDEYMLLLGAAAIASLFGFTFFCLLLSSNKNKNKKNINTTNNNRIRTTQSHKDRPKVPENGECRPEVAGNTDVIIVGAGVAGSALACTLAKVIYLSL